MISIESPALMTTEELLALPEDGVDRELIRGQLRERPRIWRDRRHSRGEARIAYLLEGWLERQPEPRGRIVSGEAGFCLSRNPDAAVGIDVAYVSADVAAKEPGSPYFEGPPVLAVEILSPSDQQEEIDEEVALSLELGVAIVWVVNPVFRTVCVYRPGEPPVLFNESQEITAEPDLPGFRAEVAKFFRR